MASDEKVLAEGDHWAIAKTKSTVEICFYCVNCEHMISRRTHYASASWRHRRLLNLKSKIYAYSIACSLCGCRQPEPPKVEERTKAYAALQRLREVDHSWKLYEPNI